MSVSPWCLFWGCKAALICCRQIHASPEASLHTLLALEASCLTHICCYIWAALTTRLLLCTPRFAWVQEAGQAAGALRHATVSLERHSSEAAASEAALSECTAGLARALEQCAGLGDRLRTEEAARKAGSSLPGWRPS